jgi:hypothetical protein
MGIAEQAVAPVQLSPIESAAALALHGDDAYSRARPLP